MFFDKIKLCLDILWKIILILTVLDGFITYQIFGNWDLVCLRILPFWRFDCSQIFPKKVKIGFILKGLSLVQGCVITTVLFCSDKKRNLTLKWNHFLGKKYLVSCWDTQYQKSLILCITDLFQDLSQFSCK